MVIMCMIMISCRKDREPPKTWYITAETVIWFDQLPVVSMQLMIWNMSHYTNIYCRLIGTSENVLNIEFSLLWRLNGSAVKSEKVVLCRLFLLWRRGSKTLKLIFHL